MQICAAVRGAMLGLQHLHAQGLRHNAVGISSVRWRECSSIYEGGVLSDFAIMDWTGESVTDRPDLFSSDLKMFIQCLDALRLNVHLHPATLSRVSHPSHLSVLSLVQASP